MGVAFSDWADFSNISHENSIGTILFMGKVGDPAVG